MPRGRGRSNASLALSFAPDRDPEDPLTRALQPPPDETPAQRDERLRAEREAKRVSNEIDEELRRERTALRKNRPIRVLLLGQSESGKSTTLKNFQIHYAPQAWHEERACWRAVVQLNLIRSVALVLDTLAAPPSNFPAAYHSDSPLGVSPPSPWVTPQNSPLTARYAPLLARLIVAERILQRRLSPTDTEEPGDYRSFTASFSNGGTLVPPQPNSSWPVSENGPSTLALPAQNRQEFFVRTSGASGSWKSRFLRRVSTSNSNGSPHSGPLRGSLDSWSVDPKDGRDEATEIIIDCREEMRRFWGDREVRRVLSQKEAEKERRVEDMPGFFLNDADRIAARGYEPSDDDVIRARLRTMGVQEHRFTFERGADSGREWRIYDIGGARSQRASWLSFFDDMDAIIFLAPISCFDETLAEDRRVNRLEDSIMLWRTLCRSPLLAKVQLILFLNKVDLLRRKIANGAHIARHVTSFGDRTNDVETVCKYFKQKFKEVQKQYSPEPRPYYVYFTSVTDTKATGVTLGIVREGILRSNLRQADFL